MNKVGLWIRLIIVIAVIGIVVATDTVNVY